MSENDPVLVQVANLAGERVSFDVSQFGVVIVACVRNERGYPVHSWIFEFAEGGVIKLKEADEPEGFDRAPLAAAVKQFLADQIVVEV